ncbi:MAG: LacI family DNA-binding transcriptional regulator [Liquorilactobacillus sp.]|uniref:LacI family DNA-binding transcriptional regulator n=1 Tax=Liquorilactobacillus sp. TaxID=2767923 RepID=UPI0039EC5FF6
MAGIKEIAEKAGVSISTVSYALNNSNKITKETRDKILKIAEELHYTPNLAGRSLKKQKTKLVEMYVPDFGGYFYGHLLAGVAEVLKNKGYELIVASGGKQSRSFISQGLVDGAIILDPTFPDNEIERLSKAGNKLVLMDRKLNMSSVSHVLLDNEKGAKEAVDALVETKTEMFAILTGPSTSYDGRKRLEAALNEFQAKGNQTVVVIPSDFTIEGGKKAAEEIIKIKREQIGVFALNDEMAFGLYEGLKKNNLAPGKDIKIVGYDNDLIGRYVRPQLATVDYSKHQWGKKAAEVLLDMIENEVTRNEVVATKLISRGSLEK